jgi:tripartite-type tricarboxylate transporter receptor subunit TctC
MTCKYNRFRALFLLAASFLAIVGFFGSARAEDKVADFYQGKKITLIVGYGPGGGYDQVARTVARYMGKYIPGNPDIIVQNMPGAGSLAAANDLYSIAPKDGTTIGIFGSDIPLVGLLGTNPAVKFDPRKFDWLGSSSSYANDAFILLVRAGAADKTIADATRPNGPPLVLGGSGAGGRDADAPKILHDTLGLNIKQILSYPDSPSLFLAVERGEIDGRMFDYSAVKTNKPQWLKPGGGFNILLQFARATRHPELPNVPTARELAPNSAARELIEFAETPILTMSRPFTAPPDVPADRYEALEKAFVAVHRDPQFLADAQKLGLDISPVDGQAMRDALERMAHGSPATFDYMKKLMAAE